MERVERTEKTRMRDAEVSPEETIEQLQLRVDQLQLAMTNIRSQIDHARQKWKQTLQVAGRRREPKSDWLIQAERALRLKGQAHQILLREISDRRKRQRQSQVDNQDRCFVRAAKELLDAATLEQIFERSRILLEESTGESVAARSA